MNAIRKCKYCGARPTVIYRNGHLDIWCPSPDAVCYPGASVEGDDPEKVVDSWNEIYGKEVEE